MKIQEAALRGLHPTQLYVRDEGGYDKTPTAFAEFIWADFFRRNIAIETVKSDFQTAVRAGISLAQSKWAKNIPGYNRK